MAKNIKDGGTRAGHNGFDPERLKKVVDKIEEYYEELASEQGEYMSRCRSIRENITMALEEAKTFGIPKKELKKVIKTRQLEAKIEKLRDDLEGDQQETYDQIRHALGDLADLPLGQAPLDKAAKSNSGSDDDKDLRPPSLKNKKPTPTGAPTAEEVGAENAKKVAAGIGPITSKEPGHPDGPAAA